MREQMGIIEFVPENFFDCAFIESKEGEWTNSGFRLPSGLVFPDPYPGMVWLVFDGIVMMIREPVCV